VRPGGFTNADPFTLQSLRGQRIVLLEFWTTSSIDAAHTMPYLSDWDGKYRNFGLTVIGVHTPRFTFERSKTVVDEYAKAHNMSFPLVIDNNAETWKAYKNSVWPHLYLIDLSGRIVYEHAGDGAYALTEQKLLDLLNARAKQLKLPAPPDQKLTKLPPDDTDPSQVKKHETFFGASRNTDLANGTAGKEGVQTFDSLSEPKLGSLYLFGGWKISREYAENLSEHTSILYRYHAKHVYSIMGSVKMVRVKVLVDGKPLSEKDAGKDVRFEKGESVFYVTHERLYDIVNSSAGYADRTIELIPETGGLDVYTLTFD
jgi:peroxiredoxin